MKLKIPPEILLVSAVMFPFAAFGPNATLGVLALSVFVIGASLLWRPGEPQILLFVFCFQWLQASVGLLHGNVVGLAISDLVQYEGNHERAVLLLQLGLLTLSVGLAIGAGPRVSNLSARARALVSSRSLMFWLGVYAIAWLVWLVLVFVAIIPGGLKQILFSLSNLKWAGFWLLTMATFGAPNRPKWPWFIVFAIEFALSLNSYFGEFRTLFFFTVLGLLSSGVRLTFWRGLQLTTALATLIIASVAWTTVKGEYRDYLNQGTGHQVVLVDYAAAVSELGRLVHESTAEDYLESVEETLGRISYYQFFGAAIDEVPRSVPHSGGEIWGEAVIRPFMPRLLFPNKREINDTELTVQFTGLRLSGAEEGTSISLGYMAEAYIDFGNFGMFLPILALGLAMGALYRWLVSGEGEHGVYGGAIATAMLMSFWLVETSALKLLSTLVLALLASWVLMIFVVPFLVSRPRAPRGKVVRPTTVARGS